MTEIGEPHYDDPSLALLFSQLRSKTLQAAKGTSEISGRAEFHFVLQIARVFCRMGMLPWPTSSTTTDMRAGCHVLALDLVRSWSFERPTVIREAQPSSTIKNEKVISPSPKSTRRSMFGLQQAMRRRSSIMIDMDIPSLPPTRPTSPVPTARRQPVIPEEPAKGEGDRDARLAGLGSLMKSAKQDVKVPEFDMNAFF